MSRNFPLAKITKGSQLKHEERKLDHAGDMDRLGGISGNLLRIRSSSSQTGSET
jgi:hypothetical protein